MAENFKNHPNFTDEDKKSAWDTIKNVLMTIVTLGINHLIKFLKK